MTRIMSGSETLSIVFPLFIKNLRLLCVFIYECEQSVSIHCNACPSPTTRFLIASVNSVTCGNSSQSSFSPLETSLTTTL